MASPRAPTAGFGVADLSLVRAVHSYMPKAQLLALLNSRRVADAPEAPLFTLTQLDEQIAEIVRATPPAGSGTDWAALRLLLGQAQRNGVLQGLTPEVLHAFAVVFSLSPAQAARMKDIVANARDEENEQ